VAQVPGEVRTTTEDGWRVAQVPGEVRTTTEDGCPRCLAVGHLGEHEFIARLRLLLCSRMRLRELLVMLYHRSLGAHEVRHLEGNLQRELDKAAVYTLFVPGRLVDQLLNALLLDGVRVSSPRGEHLP